MPKKELEELPFKLPASSWTQHILMLNWPCIRFKASTDLPNNPWEGGAIEDFNIVVEVFRVIQKDLERTGRALKKSGGELNNRTRTQGIITLLNELAIPNDPRDNGEGSTIFKESVEPPEQPVGQHAIKDAALTPKKAKGPEGDPKQGSPGSSRGIVWEHESSEGVGRQSMDWMGSVIDKAILNATSAYKYSICAKLIWEMKAHLLAVSNP